MNNKIIALIGTGALIALMAVSVSAAGDTVTATVTSEVISVTVEPATVDYGIVAFNETGISAEFTATNNGNVNETFSIRGTDATFAGGAWTLAGAIANNEFRHSVTGVSELIAEQSLTASTATWSGTVIPDETQTFTSKIYMPTAGSDGSGATATTSITLVALAS